MELNCKDDLYILQKYINVNNGYIRFIRTVSRATIKRVVNSMFI